MAYGAMSHRMGHGAMSHRMVNTHFSGVSYGRKVIQSSTGTLYSRHLWQFGPLSIHIYRDRILLLDEYVEIKGVEVFV